MKKILALAITASLMLSLGACSNKEETSASSSESTSITESSVTTETTESSETSASTEETQEPGILYTAQVSALQTGYCPMTMRDALQISTDDTFGEELTWTSSDETVATVEDGLVLPQGEGKAYIQFSDGEMSGMAIVLVHAAPEEVNPAGRLLIEKDGTLYESNFTAADWKLLNADPGYIETDMNAVYEADGVYYAKSEFLVNALCCVLGQSAEIPSPVDGMPQLSGDAAVKTIDMPAYSDLISETSELITGYVTMALPDGSECKEILYTQVYANSTVVDTVYYHATSVENVILLDVEFFMESHGATCTLRYDTALGALIVSI